LSDTDETETIMEIIKMKAEERTGTGKSVAARLRRGGQIPAVAYGKEATTLHLAVSPKELLGVLKSEHGKNSVVELGVSGSPLTVLVRDYSYHPVSRDLLHVDFIQIKLDQEVDVEVPFSTFGKCAGVVAGGQLRIVFRSLPIRCLPEQIPTKIEYDVTNLQVNEAVHASDLKLPAGVKVRFPDQQTIASVVAPEREKAEDVAAADPKAAAVAAKPEAKKKLSAPERPVCSPRAESTEPFLEGLAVFTPAPVAGEETSRAFGLSSASLPAGDPRRFPRSRPGGISAASVSLAQTGKESRCTSWLGSETRAASTRRRGTTPASRRVTSSLRAPVLTRFVKSSRDLPREGASVRRRSSF
jgi:large subunit ribosomal protein L25